MDTQQLQQLYTGLQGQVNSDNQLYFVNATAALDLPITSNAYKQFVPDGQLIINAVVIAMPDENNILIKGKTSSFQIPDCDCFVKFYIENEILNSTFYITLLGETIALPGVNWFTVTLPYYELCIPEAELPVVGIVGGTINTGVTLQVAMGYPVTDNIWMFQGLFSDPYPSISNFYQLAGGINLTTALPQPFSTLSTLGLKSIDISYDSATSIVDYMGIEISTPPDYIWQILPGVAITGIDIYCIVSGFSSSSASSTDFTITGTFTIGPPDSNTVALTAHYPNFTANVQLTEGTIQLGDLLTMFWSGTTIDLESEIQVLNIEIDPDSQNYTLNCSIVSNWVFFTINDPSLSFTMTGLNLDVNSLQGTTTGEIAGFFHIGPDDQTGVDLTIYAGYDATTWTFGASTGTDQTISLGSIAYTFLKAFGMADIPGWVTDNLPNISNVNFVTVVPDDKTKLTTYDVSGDVNWHLQYSSFDLELDANVAIKYDENGTSGTIAGIADARQMLGLTFEVGYEFGSEETQVYLNMPEFACKITYIGNTDYDSIDIKFDKISLGELITTFVGTFSPGFSLAAPWNLLDTIDLSGFEFTYTRYKENNKSSIVATIPLHIDLGFINIETLKITKDAEDASSSGVYMYFTGTFLGLPIEPDSPLQEGGKGSDATQMPPVPGMGEEFFDLKLLALGQHVSLYDSPELNSVEEAITALEEAFTTTSNTGDSTIPVPAATPDTKPGTLVFDQNSNWLIGADFTVAKFYRVATVFNDPNLYGLLIGVSPESNYFKNLQFEILYKKINDSIGMYQLDLQLPDEFRHFEFGEVSISLPIIGVQIYTNGNFYLDFGFPASITDFSRSFSIQVFPFLGYGGFYFGYLSGATSNSVPATSCGNFNPVIEFGLGLSLGVGKTVDEGILKAGLSLTAVGIFQGVLGFFSANPTLDTYDDTYYKVQGTFGLTGHIYGEVNFAIISAKVDIMAYAYITMTIESYMPIPITFEAGVSVKLTVKIHLGLFSIKVSLRFSTTISASFVVGSDTSASAPWNLCPSKDALAKGALPQNYRSLQRLSLAETTPVVLKWQPLQTTTRVPLDLMFFPQLTVSGESGAAGPQYIAMLYINTDPDNNSLFGVTEGVLYWTINALIGNTADNTGLDWLQNQTITADQINSMLCYFNTRPNHEPPFNYSNAAQDDIKTFFSTYFELNIRAVDANTEGTMDAAVFPVVPELILNTELNGTAGNPIDFATESMTGDQGYISDITTLLASTSVDYQSEMTADYYAPTDCENITDPTYEEQHNLSFPTFMFTDFVALLAKQALQSALDYLNTQETFSGTVSDVVNHAVTDSIDGISGMASRFMLHGMRLPAPPDAATGVTQPLYVLTGQQLAIPSTLQQGDLYSIILENPDESWINMVSGTDNKLTVTIDNNEIQHIHDIAAISLSPVLTYGPSKLLNYNDTPQTFSLGSPALWQYPGDYYPEVTNEPYIWKLPSNLTTIFSEQGNNWQFVVKSLTTTASGTTQADVKNYTWGTTINFTLQKITAQSGLVTPLSGNMYNLVGADDASTVYLQELLTYLNTIGDTDGTRTIQQIQIIYQPDPTQNSNGGYLSDANGDYKTAIIQANLSTETNPAESMMRMMVMETTPEGTYNTLNTAGDFVKLLWECSTVRSGGYYFYYENNATNGLPDSLFAGTGVANLAIQITYNTLINSPFVNSVIIGDSIDTSITSVFVQSPVTAPLDQQYTTRIATLLPGTVGYEVSRQNPGDYVPTQPVPTLAEDQVYLETQFNLIGLAVPAIPDYINPTPAGPVDSTDDEAVSNTEDGNTSDNDDLEDWNYNAVIPYYKYVQPEGTDPTYPNPYAGIGDTVEMVLNWQDMFGNVPPNDTQPLHTAMQVLYSDAIIALSQWPSVSVSYLFSLLSEAPNLILTFNFNTSRYKGESAQNNAQIDLQTYMNLYYQLDSPNMALRYTTTVEDTVDAQGNTTPMVHELANSELLKQFINPIIEYLKTVVAGEAAVAVQAYTLNAQMTTTNLVSLPEIALITTSFSMVRTAYLDPNFVGVAGVAEATTQIQPLSDNSQNSMLALTYFAQQFETAFLNQPYTGIILKAATGANLTKGNSDTTANAPLWMVRFDSTGANGLRFGFDKDQTYYFAPVPLATSLQSFSASIASYDKGVPDGSVVKNFNSIDMDSWGLQFLQAVDKFLSPAYSVPAFLLTAYKVFPDDPDYLQQILDAKQTIAEAIEGTIDFIIDPCSGQTSPPCTAKDPSNIGNAQEKWKQQILIQLSNAYRYVASVQTTANISSSYSGPEYADANNDPPHAPFVPNLYGKMLGLDPTLSGTDEIPTSTEYSLSTAKVPTANGASWLTYMFEAKDSAESRSFTFGDMQYNVSHMEFDITEIPDLDDYLASSWLTFIVPLSGEINSEITPLAQMGDVGETTIPVPLRSYPTPPSVTAQNFNYPANDNASPTIEEARQWVYYYTYQNTSAAQDTIVTEVQFNVTDENQSDYTVMTTKNLGMYQALAQFIDSYPSLNADFDNCLAMLTPATMDANSELAQDARYAMLAFIDIINQVAAQWSVTNQVNPRKTVNMAMMSDFTPAPPYTLGYTITESSETETDYLIITIIPEDQKSADANITVMIDNYTNELLPGDTLAYRYYQLDNNGQRVYLLYEDRNTNPSRNVVLDDLDILSAQNAWSSVAVIRNEELLQNKDGSWQTTNPLFIYQTPQVMFYNKLIPLLNTANAINIAQITTPSYPAAPSRTLQNQLLALFDALTLNIDASITEFNIKMQCDYTYSIPGTTFTIDVPVVMLTPTAVDVTAHGANIATMLTDGITNWMNSTNPQQNNGTFSFTLTAYSVTDAYVPILQIPLVLSLTAITDL